MSSSCCCRVARRADGVGICGGGKTQITVGLFSTCGVDCRARGVAIVGIGGEGGIKTSDDPVSIGGFEDEIAGVCVGGGTKMLEVPD